MGGGGRERRTEEEWERDGDGEIVSREEARRYLRLWRMRLPSVSSAAPPLSSELPCIWSRTTTTVGTFPESQSNLT